MYLRHFGVLALALFIFSLISGTPQSNAEAKEEKGTVTGTVRFSGPMPLKRTYSVNVNQEACGTTVEVEEFSLNSQNSGLKDVFISLKGKRDEAVSLPPAESVILDNLNCRIDPPVTAMRVGQFVTLKNSDPFLHSIQFLAKDRFLFDAALPKGATPVKRKIDQTGPILARCAIHPFMQSTIYVTDAAIYAFTDRNGSFQLPPVAPGKYILRVLHRGFKPIEKEVDLQAGQTINLRLDVERTNEGS